MLEYKLTKGKGYRKVTIKTDKWSKIIINNENGIYSTLKMKCEESQPMVNIPEWYNKDRKYKVIVGENRPWMPDWQEDYKKQLTRAEAKAIVRYQNKWIKAWEEEHQEMYPHYYFAYRIVKECYDRFYNIMHTTWEPADL